MSNLRNDKIQQLRFSSDFTLEICFEVRKWKKLLVKTFKILLFLKIFVLRSVSNMHRMEKI